ANAKRYKNPKEVNVDTWKALCELYEGGSVKAIGVSNFLPHHIEELKETTKILPMVNQIELHIGYMQEEVVEYNKSNGIITEAYSPLGTGALLENEDLIRIADKYKITVSKLCLSFLRQKGIVVLPKTVSPDRMRDNLGYINIEEDDVKILFTMPYIGGHAHNPDEVEF
ncbi:MAG: aldo/keto reductase, partial [Catonella sp.]|uniref:aldo/keto reductase n=1 Tax=Catonella sp. TaxID=2382125 RepID=UPI003F9FD035